jgi:hypothetical protein
MVLGILLAGLSGFPKLCDGHRIVPTINRIIALLKVACRHVAPSERHQDHNHQQNM